MFDPPTSTIPRPKLVPALLATVAVAVLLLAPVPPAAAAGDDVLTPWDVAKLRSVGDAVASPDGEHIAYTLHVQRDPLDDDVENGPAWTELHLIGPDGTSRPYVTGEVNVSDVTWSHDGGHLHFRAKREGDEHTALYAIPLAGGEARRVLSHDTAVQGYSFSPDGSQVAFLADEKPPEEEKELEEKGFDAEVFEEDLLFTRVWIAPVEEMRAGEARMLELEGSAATLHWSPAGDRLALTLAPTPLVDDSYMYRRLKVVDAESGEITAAIDNPGKLGEVAWSPDGSHLALISGESIHDPREGRLMVASADGGPLVELLPDLLGHVSDIEWADEDTLTYLAERRVRSFVATVGRDGTGGEVLVPEGETIWRSFSLLGDDGLALVAESAEHPDEVFRSTAGGAPDRLTDSNPWLAEKRLAPQEVVTFEARDGLELDGILVRPLDEEEGKRYPLILAVHGGPEAHHSDGWMTSYGSPGQVAAARGYAVLYLNYRGSTGRGVEFSMISQGDPAGDEFRDLVDGVDHLIASGLVDEDRVGITGGSYGGYATAWGSTHYSERFAAGVMFVGISEKVAKLGSSDIPKELHLVHARRWPWEDWQFHLERSPVYHVEKAQTPLLILHGTEDPRVHPSQSLILYRYLKLLGKTPVRLVWYPGEGHGNRKAAARLDYNLRMLRWFDHYLLGEGGEPPPPDLDYEPPGEAMDGDAEGDMESDAESEMEAMDDGMAAGA